MKVQTSHFIHWWEREWERPRTKNESDINRKWGRLRGARGYTIYTFKQCTPFKRYSKHIDKTIEIHFITTWQHNRICEWNRDKMKIQISNHLYWVMFGFSFPIRSLLRPFVYFHLYLFHLHCYSTIDSYADNNNKNNNNST